MFGLGSNVLNLGLLLSQLLLLLCEPLGVLGREPDHAGVRKLSMIEFPTPGTPITASLEPDESLTFKEGNDIPLSELEHVGPEFSPDQLHLTMWTEDAMLVSWATGLGRVGPMSQAPEAYDPDEVESLVEYGTEASNLDQQRGGNQTDGATVNRLVYTYKYGPGDGAIDGEGTVYQSPILHHVLLENLEPGMTYYYRVGSEQNGFSDLYNFTMPKNEYPFVIAVTADLGQTYNSSTTLDRMIQGKPDIALLAGDLSYADAYWANGTYYFWTPGPNMSYFKSYQPRWDTFGRLVQKLAAHVPFNTIAGNHELESIVMQENVTYLAYNSRYPNPQYPDRINTNADLPKYYWDQKLLPSTGKFFEPSISNVAVSNNSFHSHNAGPVHMVYVNNYAPYGEGSVMYQWLENDLKSVDRTQTPWVIMAWHAPWYSTYYGSYKQIGEMQKYMEPLLKEYKVDLVINGHVHAYERSTPVFKNLPNTCGPNHITMGDGGNSEGLTYFDGGYVDNTTSTDCQNLCLDPEQYISIPGYTPTYSGNGYIDPDVPFCYTSQAPYSDFRDPSFGHGEIILLNDTALQWRWNRNMDDADEFFDDVIIMKNPTDECTDLVLKGTSPSVHSEAKAWVNESTPAPGPSGVTKSPAVTSAGTQSTTASLSLAITLVLLILA